MPRQERGVIPREFASPRDRNNIRRRHFRSRTLTRARKREAPENARPPALIRERVRNPLFPRETRYCISIRHRADEILLGSLRARCAYSRASAGISEKISRRIRSAHPPQTFTSAPSLPVTGMTPSNPFPSLVGDNNQRR